jgi:hypothetical protein
VNRPRAADDFATIRARLEELRQEREQVQSAESELQRDPPTPPKRALDAFREQRRAGEGPPVRPHTRLGRERRF